LTPKREPPMLGCGFFFSWISCFSGFFAAVMLLAPFAIRTPRMPLTLPSFLLHVFRRQLQMYSRLSCPGKWSGSSPLSSSSKVRRSLQTLHFANAPEGVDLSSSHV
jgi:hypothetical protein